MFFSVFVQNYLLKTNSSDYCRKKKVKCYFTPGQACSNCVSYGITCEFNDG